MIAGHNGSRYAVYSNNSSEIIVNKENLVEKHSQI